MSEHPTAETLAEALPRMIEHVRNEVIPAYQSVGPSGTLAVLMMKRDLTNASAAIANQDTVAMLRAYKELEGYKL